MEIRIANLGRSYVQDDKTVEAVKDVSIEIPSNTIYGIIGKVVQVSRLWLGLSVYLKNQILEKSITTESV